MDIKKIPNLNTKLEKKRYLPEKMTGILLRGLCIKTKNVQ